jgi:hypothetical protein
MQAATSHTGAAAVAVRRYFRRLHLVSVLAMALVGSQAAEATPLFGTDGEAIGGWSHTTANGNGQPGEAYGCIANNFSPVDCGAGSLAGSTQFGSSVVDQQLGLISTHLRLDVPTGHGQHNLNAGSGATGYWFDTFTVHAPTLPFGSIVDVLVRIDLDAPVLQKGLSGGAASLPFQRLQAGITLGGPNAPATAFTRLDGAGSITTTGLLHAEWNPDSDWVFTLFGGLFGNIGVFANEDEFDSAEIFGHARYYVDVITPGATITSASGHDYHFLDTPPAGVPEPATLSLLLAGGLVLFGVRRRQC